MKSLTYILIFMIIGVCSAQNNQEFSTNTYRFTYKSELYRGTRLKITAELRDLKNNSHFTYIPEELKTELNKLFIKVKTQPLPKVYKKHAIAFLDALYEYEYFLTIYDEALYKSVQDLRKDMRRLDIKFAKQITQTEIILSRTAIEDPNNKEEIERLSMELQERQLKLESHRWMKQKIVTYKGMNAVLKPDELLHEFKMQESMNVYKMVFSETHDDISSYLEAEMIEFYHKKSLPFIHIKTQDLDTIKNTHILSNMTD